MDTAKERSVSSEENGKPAAEAPAEACKVFVETTASIYVDGRVSFVVRGGRADGYGGETIYTGMIKPSESIDILDQIAPMLTDIVSSVREQVLSEQDDVEALQVLLLHCNACADAHTEHGVEKHRCGDPEFCLCECNDNL